jgi:hypothetical protein
MSVGPKWGVLGRKRATIVTDTSLKSLRPFDDVSNTFLVLGPIDLTNGRAVMVKLVYPRCAGSTKYLNDRYEKKIKRIIIKDSVLSASSECR